jgi:hypothetical protein
MSSVVISTAVLFLLQISLAAWGLLYFQMILQLIIKDVIGILIEIALNLYIAFDVVCYFSQY